MNHNTDSNGDSTDNPIKSDGGEQSKEPTGKVVGYELQVVCPYCGYGTDTREISNTETVICGSDFQASGKHVCGRKLEGIIREVDDTA